MSDSSHPDLRSLALFSDMAQAHFETLLRGACVQNFPPRIDLITEGNPADFLHVVLSGAVDLFSIWNGRETSLATVRPVSTFILAATIRDAPYLMSARTLRKCRIALIPSKDVRAMFDVDGAFAQATVNELAGCCRTVIQSTKNLKLRTSLERLANYLVRQHARTGSKAFDLNIKKRRLASVLGMTPENLSRAFKALEPYGVTVAGSQILIEDPDDLRRFAKPTPVIDDASL